MRRKRFTIGVGAQGRIGGDSQGHRVVFRLFCDDHDAGRHCLPVDAQD